MQINTQVEVYEEKIPLKEIIGGAVAGLVLLALITAALYKVSTEIMVFFSNFFSNFLHFKI